MKHLKTSLAVMLATVATATAAKAGTVTVEQHGTRNVRVFVPTKPASPTPLIVMLHGCTQTPDDFAAATRMDALAETNGFVVAYLEQPSSTISTKCFQWYDPAHQARDAGEPKDLSDATNAIVKAHGVDPERVYVAGISAGAAMTVILGVTYPDVFTAIGVVAGIEYKGATSISEGLSAAMSGGPDPDTQGTLAHTTMGTRARVVPTFVVQGTADGIVNKVNGDQVTEQWRQANTLVLGQGAIDTAKSIPGTAGYSFTRFVQRNKVNGASVIEYYVVDGMGHAWPGGKDGGSYSDPMGPDASTLLWGFFKGRTRTSPLDVPPVVVPTSPGSPDGGSSGTSGTGGTSGASGTSGDPAGASSGDGGGSSGGCTVGRVPASTGLVALTLLGLVGIARARRKRR